MIRLLSIVILVLAAPPARAITINVESGSLGNTIGKTNVFVSSNAATSAVGGVGVALSSHTTTSGKTFYLQYLGAEAFENATTTSTIPNMGSMVWFTPYQAGAVKMASMTFSFSGGVPPRWVLEFSEPIPIPSNQTIVATVTANVSASITWVTNMIGYEK